MITHRAGHHASRSASRPRVFLSEFPGRFARFVRTIVEAMTALPSIVAGLFIYATVILILGVDASGFAASLAITVMMLPIIIRSADVVLRLVPGNLKEASLRARRESAGAPSGTSMLPTARSGLTTAVILGTARGIGETSPVLLTAGVTDRTSTSNPFSGPMVSLPLATFNFVKSPEPTMIARGFGAAAVLMVLVLAAVRHRPAASAAADPGELTPPPAAPPRSRAVARRRLPIPRTRARRHASQPARSPPRLGPPTNADPEPVSHASDDRRATPVGAAARGSLVASASASAISAPPSPARGRRSAPSTYPITGAGSTWSAERARAVACATSATTTA